ncbi:hypothetical protein ES703_33216 [subsurface metagenome]
MQPASTTSAEEFAKELAEVGGYIASRLKHPI